MHVNPAWRNSCKLVTASCVLLMIIVARPELVKPGIEPSPNPGIVCQYGPPSVSPCNPSLQKTAASSTTKGLRASITAADSPSRICHDKSPQVFQKKHPSLISGTCVPVACHSSDSPAPRMHPCRTSRTRDTRKGHPNGTGQNICLCRCPASALKKDGSR